jgi:hypothetical protein
MFKVTSSIRLLVVYDDSIELYVTVLGQGSDEEDAPVAEFWVEPDAMALRMNLRTAVSNRTDYELFSAMRSGTLSLGSVPLSNG